MLPITIVCFGDSITLALDQDHDVRWTDILQTDFNARYGSGAVRIINAGIGGNTSRDGRARYAQDVLAHRPQLVTVEFGNDAVPDRYVPVDEYADNLAYFRSELERASDGWLIPMTFTPLVDAWHAYSDDATVKSAGGPDAAVEKYREVTRTFAVEHGLPLADLSTALRTVMQAQGDAACILPDGVHLAAAGNRCVARTVTPVLIHEIEKLLQKDS